jgi:hypothetical protein
LEKISNVKGFLGTMLTVTLFCGCAHKAKEVPVEKPQSADKSWNYDRIRQVREDEAATTPVNSPVAPEAKLKDECDILGEAAMKLAKRGGCKKLDPRLGFGENRYCCPRSELK